MIRPLLLAALIAAPIMAPSAVAQRIRANPAPALETSTAPLTLDDVLQASARAAPQIIEALAKVRAAEGRAVTADGAFDTVFEADGRSRTLGYYDGTIASARATRPLPTMAAMSMAATAPVAGASPSMRTRITPTAWAR